MRGPVIFNTGDVSPSLAATLTTSPQPCAACSLISGLPLRIASLKIGTNGSAPYNKIVTLIQYYY